MVRAQAEAVFSQRLLRARELRSDTIIASDRLDDEAKHAMAEAASASTPRASIARTLARA
jgi:hypothetical protein